MQAETQPRQVVLNWLQQGMSIEMTIEQMAQLSGLPQDQVQVIGKT